MSGNYFCRECGCTFPKMHYAGCSALRPSPPALLTGSTALAVEIASLKAQIDRLSELSSDAAELAWWKQDAKELITDLCDALVMPHAINCQQDIDKRVRLLQRAREDVK